MSKLQNKLHSLIEKSQFITFYKFRINKILLAIFKYYLPIVTLFLLIFSLLYSYIGGLRFIYNPSEKITFLDCFYFSTVTFFTIGFGDIQAYMNITKIVVIIQEFISFILLALFSGYIVSIFFIRRNDVFFKDNIFIRFNGKKFVLSFPIINKGPMFYDMNAALSLTFTKKNSVISRFSLINIYTTLFKKIWYCDFEISNDKTTLIDYIIIYEILYMSISSQLDKIILPKLKLSIHGIDSQTRETAYFIKEFRLRGLEMLFIDDNYSFNNKNKYPLMSDANFIKVINILQSIVFPNKEEIILSKTGIFEIENKHINLICHNINKKLYIN